MISRKKWLGLSMVTVVLMLSLLVPLAAMTTSPAHAVFVDDFTNTITVTFAGTSEVTNSVQVTDGANPAYNTVITGSSTDVKVVTVGNLDFGSLTAVPDGKSKFSGCSDASSSNITITPTGCDFSMNNDDESVTFTFDKETTPPTSTITFPVGGGYYNSAGWTGTITGTSTDGSGSGVNKVQVSIKHMLLTPKWWDGTGFNDTSETWHDATGTSPWSYALAVGNLTDGDSYLVKSKATDNYGNVETPGSGNSFTYDNTPPQVNSITRFSGASNPTYGPSVKFTVTFSEAVTNVAFADFNPTFTGVGIPTISGVAGSGNIWVVTVDTSACSGSGTIELDMPAEITLTDLAVNPLDNLPYYGNHVNIDEQYNLLARPDLKITKTASPNPVLPGTDLTYRLIASNIGTGDASGVVVIDQLPSAYVSSIRIGVPSMGVASLSRGAVLWRVGGLNAGKSAALTIKVRVNSNAPGTIYNTATVTSSEPDQNTFNNTVTIPTTVNVQADLRITKTDRPDPVVHGNNITYTLTVTNRGPSDATNVTVTDTLPGSVTFISATTGRGIAVYGAGVVTWTIGNLNNGVTATLTIVVKTTVAGPIANTATVTATEPDPIPSNNTANAPTNVT